MENIVGKILGAIMFLGVVLLVASNYAESYKPALVTAAPNSTQQQTVSQQPQPRNLPAPDNSGITPNVQASSIQIHHSVSNIGNNELENERGQED